MNDWVDFLLWVRGPAFDIALAVFVVGILLRLFEILLLGRGSNLAQPKASELTFGLRTIVSRQLTDRGTFARAPLIVILGYLWHIGFLVALLLFVPHIELLNASYGITWPGLPNPFVDAISAVTIVTLVALLAHRLSHPVLRHLSGFEDYLVWTLTLLPLITGYLAYHRMIDPYPLALGLHILSVELLLILFPFTKLMHAITVFFARWYNGAISGRKGVQS
jgi:nitrate reductase gamma subunit